MTAPARASPRPRDVTFGADSGSQLLLEAPSGLSRPGTQRVIRDRSGYADGPLQRKFRRTRPQAIVRLRSRPGCGKSSPLQLNGQAYRCGHSLPTPHLASMMGRRTRSHNWRDIGVLFAVVDRRSSSAIGERRWRERASPGASGESR
jgi:hypothetical protein